MGLFGRFSSVITRVGTPWPYLADACNDRWNWNDQLCHHSADPEQDFVRILILILSLKSSDSTFLLSSYKEVGVDSWLK